MIEKHEAEQRAMEERKHSEEIAFLKKTNVQLKVNIHFYCYIIIILIILIINIINIYIYI